MKRQLTNAWIVFVAYLLCVEALPTFFPWQDGLRQRLAPVIVTLGFWQGQWVFFGPEPDKINVAVSAVVNFDDGSQTEWHTPDPLTFSLWQKFRMYRWTLYTDAVRRDVNRGAWEPLARYAAHAGKSPGQMTTRPLRVSLWRNFGVIPQAEIPLRSSANPFALDQRFRFYQLELGR